MTTPLADPTLSGRWWVWPDGTRLPVVSGGAEDLGGGLSIDDGGADEGGGGGGDEAAAQDGGEGDDDSRPDVDSTAEVRKWKAMARKHEARAKENADAAARLQEMEHAGKSETEKLNALLAEEQGKAREARVKALKLQVAADKGLPPQLAKFLPDLDDEVDMIDAADELLEASGSAGKAAQPARQPKSTLTNPLGDDDAAASRDALINSMVGRSPF